MAITKDEKAHIIKDFSKNQQDTGSTEVQIAILTKEIQGLTSHCKTHPQDQSSNLGLLKMVGQRKRLLRYLEKQDNAAYRNIIGKLGLRK